MVRHGAKTALDQSGFGLGGGTTTKAFFFVLKNTRVNMSLGNLAGASEYPKPEQKSLKKRCRHETDCKTTYDHRNSIDSM